LSEAVYGLGIPFVTFQVVATAALALVLSLHLSQVLNRWVLSVMVAIGLALGAAYSVKPFQIKGRGLAQVPCLWLIIFVGPMVFIAYLIDANLSLPVLIFGAAFGTLQMGIILVNTAEDYPEDIEAGIKTSIVAVGLHRGIGLAFWLVAIGAVLVEATLAVLLRQRGANDWWMLALVPSFASAVYVLLGIGRLRQSIKQVNLQESILRVKHVAKRVPVWITLVAWSTLGATYTIFYISHSRP
jgi:1,4-dihydroxy-2-naphthoate octaprenyltransferase